VAQDGGEVCDGAGNSRVGQENVGRDCLLHGRRLTGPLVTDGWPPLPPVLAKGVGWGCDEGSQRGRCWSQCRGWLEEEALLAKDRVRERERKDNMGYKVLTSAP